MPSPQVTIRSRRTILRAEERTGDMFASIDAVADKLERRIERYKGKHARNSKRARRRNIRGFRDR